MSKSIAKGWTRWVIIGRRSLLDLVNVARSHGMKCIRAYKPGLCAFNEIALHGTAAQMKATEAEWKKGGQEVHSKQPRAAFGISADVPPEKWVDAPEPAALSAS